MVRQVATALVLLSVCGLWADTAGAGDTKDSPGNELRSLQDLRRRTLKAAPTSGRGVAELEGEIIQPARPPGKSPERRQSGVSRSIAKHRVEFVFSGHDTIRREFHPTKDDLIVESYLEQDGSETYYSSGDVGSAPRAVSIRPHDRIYFTGAIEWSYSELTNVPFFEEENQDWTIVLSRGARLETNGNIVTVKYDMAPDEARKIGNLSESWSWEFDRAHGGMLTRYTHDQHIRATKAPEREMHEKYTTRWIEQDGFPIPAERTTEVKHSEAGQPASIRRHHAVFKDFSLGPIDAGEFSMENMGIPDGTRVDDLITHVGWNYGHEAETTRKYDPTLPVRPKSGKATTLQTSQGQK